MTATQQRTSASLEELQAAAAAARRGEFAVHRPAHRATFSADFSATPSATPSATCTATDTAARDAVRLVAPVARQVGDTSCWRACGPVVSVVAAHSGAGASTVSVTLAEALTVAGTTVRIVEVADASRSGLAGATTAELGEVGTGWRRGRRGDVAIDRLAFPAADITQVPTPAAQDPTQDPAEVLILDIGWPARNALAAPGWLATAIAGSTLLMVCRPTVPGIRQTEFLLAELAELAEDDASIVVTVVSVGPARWPGAVTASAGPQLRAAAASGRVITVPIDRRVETDGVSAAALPKAFAEAGKALAAAIPSAASHHRHHPTPIPQTGRRWAGRAESRKKRSA